LRLALALARLTLTGARISSMFSLGYRRWWSIRRRSNWWRSRFRMSRRAIRGWRCLNVGCCLRCWWVLLRHKNSNTNGHIIWWFGECHVFVFYVPFFRFLLFFIVFWFVFELL
jgi:hypothetical protein